MAALESAVVDPERPAYDRHLAWVKLLKVWATLRLDNLVHADAASATLHPDNYEMLLSQTKVTGPGKRVESMIATVAREAWVLCPDWLEAGFRASRRLLASTGCLLPVPTADRSAVLDRAARYSEVAGMSRALLRDLQVPGGSGEPLFPVAEAVLFWTEHSERATLPTWAAAAGCEKEARDALGRWGAKDSEVYVRNARALTLAV